MLMQAVDMYLAIRRAVGFALGHTEGYLRNFARFARARGDTHIVTATAVEWASITTSEAQRHNRLHTIIRFARFMAAEDSRHEIPPEGLFWGKRQRPMPYIFSDDEIAQLLDAASRLGPPGTLRPQTYSTLFGLLAVTGMRVSEARNLHIQDVTSDGLLIRETKFHKSRLLPLHATTRTVLDRYLDQRRRCAGAVPHLFVTRRGCKLSHTVVSETFHQVLKAAGIPQRPARRRLRLMDLRHTFAVRALEQSPETRHAIGRHTLALTTYMGHACVSDTYWYLETTPQLMTDIATACETFMQGGTS
jgi:integrase/recombinase XerD